MYIVTKRYTASELRARLSEALDEVERSGEVVVDRGNRTFRIVTADAAKSKAKRRRLDFELTDDRLLQGWAWEWRGPGRPLKLRAGGGPKRRRRS
jgi:prevent-host-death family protein